MEMYRDKDEKSWYVGKRAEQLAVLYLSRRNDIEITARPYADYGPDFLVSICKENEYTGRIFGIQLKARVSLQPVCKADKNEIKLDIGTIPVPEDIPFPLCLFVFAMENDDGYYRWIKKPVIDPYMI